MRKTVRTCILGLIALLVMMAGFIWFYTLRTVRQQSISYGSSTLELITADLRSQLDRMDKYLVSLEDEHASFHRLGMVQDEITVFEDVQSLAQEFGDQLEANDHLQAILLYSEVNDTQYLAYGNISHMSTASLQTFKAAIREHFAGSVAETYEKESSWCYMEMEGYRILYKTIAYEGVYCTSIMSLDILLAEYQDVEAGYILYLQDGTGLTVCDETLTGTVILSDDMVGPFYVGLMLQQDMAGDFSAMFIVLSAVTVVLVLLVIFLYRQIRHHVLEPVDRLTVLMQEIGSGKREFGTGQDLKCEEFVQLQDTFNELMVEIKTLQIARYEKQLEAQKYELQMLQSQIRPHFYLNCLKNIYVMAEQQRYEGMKSAILALSRHLRYVFSTQTTIVTLEQELDYLKNYAELYRSSFSRLVIVEADVPEELLTSDIPSISLLTFMENSIKYAAVNGGALKIHIAARIITNGGAKLTITYRDNGKGYDPDTLKLLNSGEMKMDPEGHVGIYNVVYRCRLLYGDDFRMAFYNDHGAVIDLLIPLTTDGMAEG